MKNQLIAILFLLSVVSTATIAEPIVEVITVNNRPASEIQPLLAPLLENTDRVVANGDSLIVKTTPDRLQTITNIIRKLDSPLNSLQITVIQSRGLTAEQLNAGVDFDAQITNPAGFGNRPDGYSTQFRGRIQNNILRTQDGTQKTQTIRTMDGVTAHIKTGKVQPITNYQSFNYGYGYPGISQSTQLVEATTGFAVTPRLAGQQVVLDVSPWSDRINGQGQLQTQEADTSIRANLGEWVEIGGVDESGQSSGSGAFSYNRHSTQNNVHILVKVELVN